MLHFSSNLIGTRVLLMCGDNGVKTVIAFRIITLNLLNNIFDSHVTTSTFSDYSLLLLLMIDWAFQITSPLGLLFVIIAHGGMGLQMP